MFLPNHIYRYSSSDNSLSELDHSSSEDCSVENDLVSVDSVVDPLSFDDKLSSDNTQIPTLVPSSGVLIEPHDNGEKNLSSDDFSTVTLVLVKNIQETFEKSNTYMFRSTEIDGIYCSFVLYRDENIVSVESTRVIVITNQNKVENYSLHYEYYDSISHAIEIIKTIVKTYKLYNGDLYSPEDYAYLLAEENIIPFSETERCCVCNINTTDMTTCNHYICFRCRENALRDGNRSCVYCNTPNVLHIYHSENISNNQKYTDINSAVESSLSFDNNRTPKLVPFSGVLADTNDTNLEYMYAPEYIVATELCEFIRNNREAVDNTINVISSFINMYKRWFMRTTYDETITSVNKN